MDNQDFNRLLDRHREMIHRLIHSKCGSDQDVDDIMQEVFLNIYQNIDSFKGESKIRTWVYTITKNCIADYYRQPWWKFKWLPLLHEENENISGVDPFFQTSEKQSLVNLNKILAILPQQQAAMFRLRFIEHLSLQDISELKNMNKNTVKTHLYRAVKKVRQELTAGDNI
jgi:RNA polymerase sigma-70 factor (ECF subfamily)